MPPCILRHEPDGCQIAIEVEDRADKASALKVRLTKIWHLAVPDGDSDGAGHLLHLLYRIPQILGPSCFGGQGSGDRNHADQELYFGVLV